jgi:hypothetical protein
MLSPVDDELAPPENFARAALQTEREPEIAVGGEKMRSPASAGEELPRGKAVFQTTFWLGPNSTGRRV